MDVEALAARLHDFDLGTEPDGCWWACHQPERPHVDGLTFYDERCAGCLIAMRAAVETGRLTRSVLKIDPTTRHVDEEIPAAVWMRDYWPDLWQQAREREEQPCES